METLLTILKSDELLIDHENTTFTLVDYWLKSRDGWADEEKQAAFDKIIEGDVLRFYHMDTKYLLLYALRNPWMQANRDLSLDILQAAALKDIGAEMHQRANDRQEQVKCEVPRLV